MTTIQKPVLKAKTSAGGPNHHKDTIKNTNLSPGSGHVKDFQKEQHCDGDHSEIDDLITSKIQIVKNIESSHNQKTHGVQKSLKSGHLITASDSKKPSDDVKKAHGSSVVELNAFKETVDGCSTTQYHEDNATTVKTPRQNQGRNISSKVGELPYGIFDESHQKSKAGLSHISPFSQKFNFSGAGISTAFRGGFGHSNVHYQFGNQSSVKGRVQNGQIGEFNSYPDIEGQQKTVSPHQIISNGQSNTNCVNPFITQNTPFIRSYQDSQRDDSIFGGANSNQTIRNGKVEEEDFEIKPQNIYGQQPISQLPIQPSPQKSSPESNEPTGQSPEYDPSQMDEMMQQQHLSFQQFQQMHYQQYLESSKSHQAQQMMIRSCPVHGEGAHFKESMNIMQAQAHAYAFSCFIYFQQMVKLSRTAEEKAYFQQQQEIAGCMVHGPHGMTPAGLMPPPHMIGMHFGPQRMMPFGPQPFGFGQFMPQELFEQSQKSSQEPQADAQIPLHFQGTFGENAARQPKNRIKDQASQEQKKLKPESDKQVLEKDNGIVEIVNKTPSECLNAKQQPVAVLNQHHANTIQKIYPQSKAQATFEDQEKFIHNTTGDKDRKRRKTILKTLSDDKMYLPVTENRQPKIGQFCPETHEQQSVEQSQVRQAQIVNQAQYEQMTQMVTPDQEKPQMMIQNPVQAFQPQMMSGQQFSHPFGYQSQMSNSNQSPFINQHQMTNEAARKKRNRKNPNQMQYLMQEYLKDPNWTKETCCRVSQATGLTESQVYKWGWDQKNKKIEEAGSQLQHQNDSQSLRQELQKNSEIYANQLKDKRDSAQTEKDNGSNENKQEVMEMPKEFNIDESQQFVTPKIPKQNQVQNTNITTPFTSEPGSNSQNKPIFVIQSGKSQKMVVGAVQNKQKLQAEENIDLIFAKDNQNQQTKSSKKSSNGISDHLKNDSKNNQISDNTSQSAKQKTKIDSNQDSISNNNYQTTLSHNLKLHDNNIKDAIATTVIGKDELTVCKTDSQKKKKQQTVSPSPQVLRMTTRSRNTTPIKVISAAEQDKENKQQCIKRTFKESQPLVQTTHQALQKKRDQKTSSKELSKENIHQNMLHSHKQVLEKCLEKHSLTPADSGVIQEGKDAEQKRKGKDRAQSSLNPSIR